MTERDHYAAQDDHAIDPVCGASLRTDDAVASFEHQGKTFFFSHIKCKMLFEREPDSYLQKGPPAANDAAPARSAAVLAMPKARSRLLFVAGGVATAMAAAVVIVHASRDDQSQLATTVDEPTAAPAVPAAAATSAPATDAPSALTPRPEEASAKPEEAPAKRATPGSVTERPPARATSASTTTNSEARAAYELGNRYLAEGKTGEAIASFKRATGIDGRFAEAYAALGLAYQRQDNPKLAVEALMTYLKLSPSGREANRVRQMIRAYGAKK